MKPTAKLRFAACLATLLAGTGPTDTIAAEDGVMTQDLVNVNASDLVTSALWSRLPDSYTLQVVFDRVRYDEKRRAMAAANPVTANSITSISAAEMDRLGIVNVADALAQLVPQNIGNYMPSLIGDPRVAGAAPPPVGTGTGMSREDRARFFIGATIANLRGMDPSFGCRTLSLVDGRRAVAGQPLSPPPPQPGMVDQRYPPKNKYGRVEAWLLKADGTQILPVAYSCGAEPGGAVGVWIEYKFSIGDSAQAVAAAFRIDDAFYIDKLQPLEPKPAAQ